MLESLDFRVSANQMNLRGRILFRWRRYWTKHSGQKGFGRFASWLASLSTSPYHGRTFLADFNTHGFIAPTAAIAHPDFAIGAHAYVGDNVIAIHDPAGGAIRLGDRTQLYGNTFLRTGAGAGIHIGTETHVQPGCYFVAMISDIKIRSERHV